MQYTIVLEADDKAERGVVAILVDQMRIGPSEAKRRFSRRRLTPVIAGLTDAFAAEDLAAALRAVAGVTRAECVLA